MGIDDMRAHLRRQESLIRRVDAQHRILADDVAAIAERAQTPAQARLAAKQIRRRVERTERAIASDIRLHVQREIRYGIRVAVRERGVRTTFGQVDRLRGTVARQLTQDYGMTATQLVKQYASITSTDAGRYLRAHPGNVVPADVKQLLRSRDRPYRPELAPGEGVARSLDANIRRVIAGEGNRAFRAGASEYANVAGAEAVRWHLNPRHPEPDPCDTLASQDLYGLGPGVYPPDAVPLQPHPHCKCWLETIWVESEEVA